MQDENIIELYFSRNETAISETDKKYSSYLRKIINMVLANKEDQEECLNDTYMTVWGKIPPDRPNFFRAYIAKIARNTALNRYDYNNAAKRNPNLELILSELEDCIPDTYTVEDEIEGRYLRELLNSFLYGLEADKRVLFLRRYWFGISIEELASERGCGKSKIKTALFRIRNNLREYLEKEGIKV
ncbi:MAG: sigma-70 family RNA polymerase sigma factor [Lachnospiraceae bacterium]|nr:sigma-70 family RNA polymerase sigma factor [Lachnospiraceae bacterium]